jgi:pimeloyl-ACP methyl ester carboxylesterase
MNRAPRVVLLHSGFSTGIEWRRTVALLPELDTLTPTLPGGTGAPGLDTRASMLTQSADHVERLLREAGWSEPVPIVGSSFGGHVALELLARGTASRVVALAPPWTGSLGGLAFYLALFTPALTAMRATRPLWPRTSRNDLMNTLFFHSSRQVMQIDHEDVEAMIGSMAGFPFFRVGLHGGGPGDLNFEQLQDREVTLVFGSRDLIVPRWMQRRWRAALPNASVAELHGFPHQPHLRDPQRVASLVRRLVEGAGVE